jgi:hypothetical protein
MTAARYRSALAQLGLTPTTASRLLGISDRTSRRYASQGVHGPADLLMRLLLAKRVTASDINFAQRYRSI